VVGETEDPSADNATVEVDQEVVTEKLVERMDVMDIRGDEDEDEEEEEDDEEEEDEDSSAEAHPPPMQIQFEKDLSQTETVRNNENEAYYWTSTITVTPPTPSTPTPSTPTPPTPTASTSSTTPVRSPNPAEVLEEELETYAEIAMQLDEPYADIVVKEQPLAEVVESDDPTSPTSPVDVFFDSVQSPMSVDFDMATLGAPS